VTKRGLNAPRSDPFRDETRQSPAAGFRAVLHGLRPVPPLIVAHQTPLKPDPLRSGVGPSHSPCRDPARIEEMRDLKSAEIAGVPICCIQGPSYFADLAHTDVVTGQYFMLEHWWLRAEL
jgi:hypothetical protein